MSGFLLDTNVISEATKRRPNPLVSDWIKAQAPQSLFLATPVIGELQRGIQRLDPGQRRGRLASWFEDELIRAFAGRILSYDEGAARRWGAIMAAGDREGLSRAAADALIASIADQHGLAVVTRNIDDFSGMGVPLVNPWIEQRRR